MTSYKIIYRDLLPFFVTIVDRIGVHQVRKDFPESRRQYTYQVTGHWDLEHLKLSWMTNNKLLVRFQGYLNKLLRKSTPVDKSLDSHAGPISHWWLFELTMLSMLPWWCWWWCSTCLLPGTYCQQREVEAITEGVEEDEGRNTLPHTPGPGFLRILK